MLAYAELTAFDRLAEDARLAPTLAGRAALARMAAAEIGHHVRLTDRLTELGVDPAAGDGAVRLRARRLPREHPARAPGSRAWSRPTSATGWPPTSTARSPRFLPEPDRALVLEVLADTGHADFAVREVRAAIAADRKVAGRLALWGRRLVGEAMTQSQAVIAEHDGLAELIITGTGDLAGVGRLIERITDGAHRAHGGAGPQPG